MAAVSLVAVLVGVLAITSWCGSRQDRLDRGLQELLPIQEPVVWRADCGNFDWIVGGQGCARALVGPRDRTLDQRLEALEIQAAAAGWRVTSRGGGPGGPSISWDLVKGDLMATVVLLTPAALEASCPRNDHLSLCNDSFTVEPR